VPGLLLDIGCDATPNSRSEFVFEARRYARRGVFGVLAAGAAVVCAVVANPSAGAAPDSCTAANLTETISTVNHNLSQYLAAHPDANQALGDAAKQSPFQALGSFSKYFDAHPQEADEVRAIQQPLKDLSDQCGYQVTPGQVLVALGDL
jgi:heme-binding protein